MPVKTKDLDIQESVAIIEKKKELAREDIIKRAFPVRMQDKMICFGDHSVGVIARRILDNIKK
jgi:hypothetical protein